MRVYGIDANALTREKRTGTERYVFELLKEMKKCPLRKEERVVLYASAPLPELNPLPAGWSVHVLRWPFPFKGWTHIRLSLALWRRTPNVFFTPAHEIPLYPGRGKIVSTVHDVAFRHFPELYSARAAKRQEWSISRVLRRAHNIISVSEATKADVVQFYGANPTDIYVIPLGIRSEAFSVEGEVPEKPYFLFVGRVEKKKNISTLVRAFEDFKERTGSDVELVLAGSLGHGGDEIQKQVDASPVSDSIRMLGYVKDREMIPLMRGALGFVFPSKFEGFGMPALEAMAAEIPLIASDIPALREAAGSAAIFVSPDDWKGWSENLQRIFEDGALREQLVMAGRRRVAGFSWSQTARRTWKVLRSV